MWRTRQTALAFYACCSLLAHADGLLGYVCSEDIELAATISAGLSAARRVELEIQAERDLARQHALAELDRQVSAKAVTYRGGT